MLKRSGTRNGLEVMGFFFKKSRAEKAVLKSFNGRQINSVTRRNYTDDGGVKETIIGKNGRVAVVDGNVHIICGTEDVFLCPVEKAQCNLLLSGNGATVEGENAVTGEFDRLIVYYNKLG